MERLTGGLQYCRSEGCTETVHPEDYPNHYPFCDLHKKRNESYHEWRLEQKKLEDLGEEIKRALT